MAKIKDNDAVGLRLANPGLSMQDLDDSGFSGSNISIGSENDYLGLNSIQTNPKFQDENGKFDQNKFHKFYQDSLAVYNRLATTDRYVASKYDIFAPVSQRDWSPQFSVSKIDNPLRVTHSMIDVGESGPQTMSIEEIAETQKVWDEATKKWQESPNDDFFGNFKDVRVLAQYDQDVDANGNPTSDPNKIAHRKGEYKLNDEGTYYYENANGRNITGKRVLNIGNVLTTDGSALNAIDFIDSDDMQKSPMGALVKNVALVGSMFLPYVGPFVTCATLLQQSLKLGATLGKMYLGSDNKTMNTIQGFMDATNLQESTSEYAKDPDNAWCWENLINLVGQTVAQLKQQRFIFEKAPALIFGKDLSNPKVQEALKATKFEEFALENTNKPLIEDNIFNKMTSKQAWKMINDRQAQTAVEKAMQKYYHVGGTISKAYMTGITVNDMYDEAKQAGASDVTAMAMTLGYAAAEAWLLNTGIGEMILPELRSDRRKIHNVVKALGSKNIAKFNELANNATTATERNSVFRNIFNKAKKLYNAEGEFSLAGKSGVGAVMAGSLGEGTEEVTEEVLADFVRATHDVANYLSGGNDKNMFSTANMGQRYAMNFLGGLLGGGINAGFSDFRLAKSYENMTPEDAIKHVIEYARNGKLNQIYQAIDKMDFGNKQLSTELEFNDDGSIIGYKPGTETDNQNEFVKTAARNFVNLINNTLTTAGATMSDKTMTDKAVQEAFGDLRYQFLSNTISAGKYLDTFYNKLAKLSEAALAVKQSESPEVKAASGQGDTANKSSNSWQEQHDKLEKEYKDKLKEVQDFVEGGYQTEFITNAVIEMNQGLLSLLTSGATFDTYLKTQAEKLGKNVKDLSEEERQKYLNEYHNYVNTNKKDDIQLATDQYLAANRLALKSFFPRIAEYEKEATTYEQRVGTSLSLLDILDKKNQYDSFVKMATLASTMDENLLVNEADALSNTVDNPINQNYKNQLIANGKKHVDLENEIKNKEINDTYTKEDQDKEIQDEQKRYILERHANTINYLINQSTTLVHEATEKGWMNPIAKQKLQATLETLQDIINPIIDSMESQIESMIEMPKDQLTLLKYLFPQVDASEFEFDPDRIDLDEFGNEIGSDSGFGLNVELGIQDLLNTIQNNLATLKSDRIKNSPILEFLDAVNIDINGKDYKFSQLLKDINGLVSTYKGDMSQFIISDENIRAALNQAIKATTVMQALILGARTDNKGVTAETSLYDGNFMFNTDLMGVNVTLNQVNAKNNKANKDKWVELPTLNKDTADKIMQDLMTINEQLHLAIDLHSLNAGQKFIKQPKIQFNSIKLIYNKMVHFLNDVVPNDGTWDTAELNNLINNNSEVTDLFENDIINNEILRILEEYRINVDKAIYNFYQNNIVSGKHTLEELLDMDKWNLLTDSSVLLTEHTKELDDNNFLWYFAARCAVNAEAFYNAFRQSIHKEIAPLAGQELGIYLGVANIVNGDVLKKFQEVSKTNLLTHLQNMEEKDRIAALQKAGVAGASIVGCDEFKSYLINLDIFPKYGNVIFVEGVPGAGKTRAVLTTIVDMLKQSKLDEAILKNAYVVSTSEDTAKELAGQGKINESGKVLAPGLNLESYQAFGHKELLQKISDWKQSTHPHNGGFKVKEGVDYEIINGEIKTKYTSKNVSDTPKVIFIDEGTRLTDLEWQIVNNFAELNGIKVLTFGDLDQTIESAYLDLKVPGISEKAKLTNKDDVIHDSNFRIGRNNFMHCPKLGDSIRTANVLQNDNINLMQTLISTKSSSPIKLNYFEGIKDNKYTFNGTKVITNQALYIKETEAWLDKIILTLEKGEKIGLIYPVKDSVLYSEIAQNDKYKDYIEAHEGTSAQGLEGKYYIIETDNTTSKIDFLKNTYTGITRASEGSLLLTVSAVPGDNEMTIIENKDNPKTTTQIEEVKSADIERYFNTRKSNLDSVLEKSTAQLTVNEPTKTSSTQPTNQATVQPQPTSQQAPHNQPVSQRQSSTPPVVSTSEVIFPEIENIEEKIDQTIYRFKQYLDITDELKEKFDLQDVNKVKGIIVNKEAVAVIAIDNKAITVHKNDNIIRDKFPFKEITNPPTQPINQATTGGTDDESKTPEQEQQERLNQIAFFEALLADPNGLAQAEIDNINQQLTQLQEEASKYQAEHSQDEDQDKDESQDNEGDSDEDQDANKDQGNDAGENPQPNQEQLKQPNNIGFLPPISEKAKEDEETVIVSATDTVDDNKLTDSLQQLLDNPTLDTTGGKTIRHLLFTMSSFELGGYTYDERTKTYKCIKGNENRRGGTRIDSLNGILNLAQVLKGNDQYQLTEDDVNSLARIHSYIKYGYADSTGVQQTDLASITEGVVKAINNLFQGTDLANRTPTIDFALKCSARTKSTWRNNNADAYSRYDKSQEEQPLYDPTVDNEEDKLHRKQIVMRLWFNDDNGDRKVQFEVPVMILNSPLTLIDLKDSNDEFIYKEAHDTYVKYLNQHNDAGNQQEYLARLDLINDQDLINRYPDLINLFKLFIFTGNATYTFNKNPKLKDWTPAKDLQNYGIQIDTKKGKMQSNLGLQANGEITNTVLTELQQQKNIRVSDILISTSGYYEFDGQRIPIGKIDPNDKTVIAKAGTPFVFVTDDLSLNNTHAMEEVYAKAKGKTPRVKVLMVSPPLVSFDKYMDVLKTFGGDRSTFIRPVGNTATIYRIWSALVQDPRVAAIFKTTTEKTLFNNIKEKVLEVDDAYNNTNGDYSKAVELLKTEYTWKNLGGTNDTLERNLLHVLKAYSFTTTFNPTQSMTTKASIDDLIPTDNYNLFKQIVEANGVKLYNTVKYKKTNTKSALFKEVQTDSENDRGKYTINGQSFTANVRLTTAAFSTKENDSSISDFINNFVNHDLHIAKSGSPNPWIYLKTYPGDKSYIRGNSDEDNLYLGRTVVKAGRQSVITTINRSKHISKLIDILQNEFGYSKDDFAGILPKETFNSEEEKISAEREFQLALMEKLNNDINQPYLAIMLDGQLKISGKDEALKQVITGIPETLNFGQSGQIVLTDLRIGNEVYTATIDKKSITLTQAAPAAHINVNLSEQDDIQELSNTTNIMLVGDTEGNQSMFGRLFNKKVLPKAVGVNPEIQGRIDKYRQLLNSNDPEDSNQAIAMAPQLAYDIIIAYVRGVDDDVKYLNTGKVRENFINNIAPKAPDAIKAVVSSIALAELTNTQDIQDGDVTQEMCVKLTIKLY